MRTHGWLLLNLADAEVARRRLGSGSVTPAGLMGQGGYRASSNGDVNAPERARLPLLVERRSEAVCQGSESEHEPRSCGQVW